MTETFSVYSWTSGLQRCLALFVFVFSLVFPDVLSAVDFSRCVTCHGESLKEDASKIYPHSPFSTENCGMCHLVQESHTAGRASRNKTRWLAKTAMEAKYHAFMLDPHELGEALVVEVPGADGGFFHREITIPGISRLDEVEDDGKGPVISAPRVLEVRHGIFVSATIGWETAVLADGAVAYGKGELTQTSGPAARLGRQHQVVLGRLRPDQEYHFQVVSEDLFGRREASEVFSFTTAKPFSTLKESGIETLPLSEEAEIDSRFRKIGDRYLLELTLPLSATVFVGTSGPPLAENLGAEEYHQGLGTIQAMSLKACLVCHDSHAHPVDVVPQKAGIKIPEDFPTLKDGRITCATCHEPHAANNPDALRRASRQELCISCHLRWAK